MSADTTQSSETPLPSRIRLAALDGLRYAAALVERFGWHPCAPGTHLDLWAHLNVAAGKAALDHGQHADDVNGLMGYLLAQHLDTNCFHDWEAEPGRASADVHAALLEASGITAAARDDA